jgi:hypothetical protein
MKREGILQKIGALCIRTRPSAEETKEVDGEILTILCWDYTGADQNKDGNPLDKWHVNLNVFDGKLRGGISGYCDDDADGPGEVFCFASKTCDTSETILEFLERDFAAWTCNMEVGND